MMSVLPIIRERQGRHGFTLLEVMLAVAIAAIVFVSLLAAQGQSISLALDNRIASVAPQLALGQMNILVLARDFTSQDGDFGESFSQYTWALESESPPANMEAILMQAHDEVQVLHLAVFFGDDPDPCYRLSRLVYTGSSQGQ